MTDTTREKRVRRRFGMLMLLYPSSFRRRHGAAMTETFLACWRASKPGFGSRLVFWTRAGFDALKEGLRERMAGIGGGGSTDPHRPGPDSENGPGGHPGGLLVGWGVDFRMALRGLWRSPGFAILVALTLGLGVGANLAVFRVVDAVLLRPLPIAEPARVVQVEEAISAEARRGGIAFPTFRQLRAARTGLTAMAAFVEQEVEIVDGNRVEVGRATLVSGDYFALLGVHAAQGRPLLPSDEGAPGADPVVVLSHRFWLNQFGGDRGIVGRTIRIGGHPLEVVGVAAEGFEGTRLSSPSDLWIPVTMAAEVSREGIFASSEAFDFESLKVFRVLGRLAPGVTNLEAEERLNSLRIAIGGEALAEEVKRPISLRPVREAAATARDELQQFLGILVATVVLTFLVAGVNVAHLLILRGRKKRRDLAVRAALGASRLRLVRQLSIEGFLLGALGGLTALGVAKVTLVLLSGFTLPGGISVSGTQFEVGGGVLGIAVGAAVASIFLFGFFPIVQTSRPTALSGLRSRSERRSGRGLLLAVQATLSVVLLVGAALFGRTLQRAMNVDLGVEPGSTAAVTVRLRAHGWSVSEVPGVVRELIRSVEQQPGAERVALALHVPVAPRKMALPFDVADEEGASRAVPGGVALNVVTPGYFEILGIELLAGRTFDRSDAGGAPPVIMVNEAAARLLWPERADPIGARGKIGFNREMATVVGLVEQTVYHGLGEDEVPYVFYPLGQQTGLVAGEASLLARGSHGGAAALDALRSGVRQVDPTLPVLDARAVSQQLAEVLAPQRFGATLFGLFGLLALAIAAVGIYGVTAQAVAERQREIGIRMALGARTGALLRTVLGTTLGATVAGAVVGLALSAGLARFLATFLYGIAPVDWPAFLIAVFGLLVTAGLATFVPARRAVHVDPTESIRVE